jgi:hypothetical protein
MRGRTRGRARARARSQDWPRSCANGRAKGLARGVSQKPPPGLLLLATPLIAPGSTTTGKRQAIRALRGTLPSRRRLGTDRPSSGLLREAPCKRPCSKPRGVARAWTRGVRTALRAVRGRREGPSLSIGPLRRSRLLRGTCKGPGAFQLARNPWCKNPSEGPRKPPPEASQATVALQATVREGWSLQWRCRIQRPKRRTGSVHMGCIPRPTLASSSSAAALRGIAVLFLRRRLRRWGGVLRDSSAPASWVSGRPNPSTFKIPQARAPRTAFAAGAQMRLRCSEADAALRSIRVAGRNSCLSGGTQSFEAAARVAQRSCSRRAHVGGAADRRRPLPSEPIPGPAATTARPLKTVGPLLASQLDSHAMHP